VKAVAGKAWLCSRCNTPYTHKNSAEICCLCVECTEPTQYSGHHRHCQLCGLRKVIASNVERQVELEKYIIEQRGLLAALERTRQASETKRKNHVDKRRR
jgi:hypothetical protein